MSFWDALAMARNVARLTWNVPWVPYAVLLGLILLMVGALSRRTWVQGLVAAGLLAASATYSIWVLPVGVMLAGFGLVLVVAGAIWKHADRKRPHVGGGLMWPGLGLLVAPLANIFLVMPILRTIH